MTTRKSSMLIKKLTIAVIIIFLGVISLTVNSKGLMTPVPGEPEAQNFTLMSANGGEISLDEYKGKFVLINFWATWCPPCIKEMPALNTLHNELKPSGLNVVGIHVGPALVTVKQFLKERPVDFDIVIDKNMSLASWEVAGLPTTFLVSPSGQIIYRAVGERVWDSKEMISFLKNVIGEHERVATIKSNQEKL